MSKKMEKQYRIREVREINGQIYFCPQSKTLTSDWYQMVCPATQMNYFNSLEKAQEFIKNPPIPKKEVVIYHEYNPEKDFPMKRSEYIMKWLYVPLWKKIKKGVDK